MSFWHEWLEELDTQPDLAAVQRASQGARLWLEIADDEPPAPFDLDAWAESWSRRWGLTLAVTEGTPLRREGSSRWLGALLRALCWEQFPAGPPALQVAGDGAELRVVAPGQESRWVPRPGVLVTALAERGPVQLGRDGSWLLRCACPALGGPAAGEEALPAVDLNTLQRSTMDDPEFEDELIDAFLEEGAGQLEALARDYNSRTLHSLKGSANMVGALRFAAMLEDQEHRLQPAFLPQLTAEFAAIRSWLERYRAARG